MHRSATESEIYVRFGSIRDVVLPFSLLKAQNYFILMNMRRRDTTRE